MGRIVGGAARWVAMFGIVCPAVVAACSGGSSSPSASSAAPGSPDNGSSVGSGITTTTLQDDSARLNYVSSMSLKNADGATVTVQVRRGDIMHAVPQSLGTLVAGGTCTIDPTVDAVEPLVLTFMNTTRGFSASPTVEVGS